jgi:copper resistance protein D
MRSLYLVAVWLHLLSMAVWLGSMLFMALVLVPALRKKEDPRRRSELIGETGERLRRVAWIAFAVLLLTGIVQLGGRGFAWRDVFGRLWLGPLGHILAWKLGAFALVVALSAIHDFWLGPRSTRAALAGPEGQRAERARRLASWMGRLNVLLGLLIVLLAVLYVRGPF